MALITYQIQGPYPTFSLSPESWTRRINLRSSVAFQLMDRTGTCVPLKRRFSLRGEPINLSKGKPLQVLAFKGNAQNEESNRSDSCSKFNKSPVQFSRTQEEREEMIGDAHDTQTHPISYASADREGTVTVQKLFRKWLLILRTQTSSQANESLGESLTPSETSEGQIVTPRAETKQLVKSVVMYFLRLDAAISLPLLIFIPFYLGVRVVYGAEVTKELTPMWVLGPLIIALYVKIVQGLYSSYVLCFMYTGRLVKKVPSVYNYIAKGELKEYLWARFWKPIEDMKKLDYKDFLVRKLKQLQEWAVEKYLDFVESIWPYYCRTIRFLKKANLI
ncbi:uncharacterized protein M6B38_283480 [Iris pallida]|uniref:Embryo defective 2759 n=1 Tax=Iris pallida TaxID=29817 RepID=A0AAX6I0Q8_IRIPA|nr:Uncharacterized protein M6B38_223325 [Iris pallida]KAJ6808301.1 uncharacterized protein M6B38_168000 [Iris pallida]KAJ6846829.1 uncharacterized protein M6B38_283480 [Iris pallida]